MELKENTVSPHAGISGQEHSPSPRARRGTRAIAPVPGLKSPARAGSASTDAQIGFVPQDFLDVLYAGAGLFVYPSRYEGFGLPVVEAMAHGIPCISGNAACLIEVAQGAAKIVDPDNIESFSQAIAEALGSATWREQAADAGRVTASRYCWDRCAAETAQIYRSISD